MEQQPKQAKRMYSTTDAVDYLRREHNIDLTSTGLRIHVVGNKRHSEPTLQGELHPSMGVYFFSADELDRFAVAYLRLQKSGNRWLGRVGRKRRTNGI